MKRPKKIDYGILAPKEGVEFDEYIKLLKKAGQYENFLFFHKVLIPTREAGERRWAAIRRAADALALDPNDQDDCMVLLGALSYKLFPPQTDRKKRNRKLDQQLARLNKHLAELYLTDPSFIEKIKGNRAQLARMLYRHSPKEYHSVGAAEKHLKRKLSLAIEKAIEKTNS
jgi:hypothetical protein